MMIDPRPSNSGEILVIMLDPRRLEYVESHIVLRKKKKDVVKLLKPLTQVNCHIHHKANNEANQITSQNLVESFCANFVIDSSNLVMIFCVTHHQAVVLSPCMLLHSLLEIFNEDLTLKK